MSRYMKQVIAKCNQIRLPNFYHSSFIHPSAPGSVKIYNVQKRLQSTISSPLGQEPFANSMSSTYLEDMYNRWAQDPASVHASWDSYFRRMNEGGEPGQGYMRPPDLAVPSRNTAPVSQFAPMMVGQSSMKNANVSTASQQSIETIIDEQFEVQSLIRSYQIRGHRIAQLDPLGINAYIERDNLNVANPPKMQPENLISDLVFKAEVLHTIDLERSFKLPRTTFIGGPNEKYLPLNEILSRLKKVYCGSIGAEFMYVTNLEHSTWIRRRLETPGANQLAPETKKLVLNRLTQAYAFEAFLAKKWSSEKRFGLEGAEMLIPAMMHIIDRSTDMGVESYVMGMPHRGRLNVLANVCGRPVEQIFGHFNKLQPKDEGSGDVKYHLGTSIERLNQATGKNIRLTVVANPSHLEAVDPVVQGKVRAEQFIRGDNEGKKVMSIILHGDAAFSGQGIVYETFHLSELIDYTTKGTIHIVVNNQIGFTTDPRRLRSSPYCTDVARVVNAPIFHVNSDDPEAVIHVCNVATEWRDKFQKDVVIDLVCYRRNGHNEIDEPMFTQPLMYTRIRSLKSIYKQYSEKLIKEGIVSAEEVKEMSDSYEKMLESGFEKAASLTDLKYKDWIDSPWGAFFEGKDPLKMEPTGVSEETLLHVGKYMSTPPPKSLEFVLHRGVDRILKGRQALLDERQVDWALAEGMAFGSLLKAGVHVRISGQDVERGTFSHRHHVYHHQKIDQSIYKVMAHLYPDQAPYTSSNSSLAEYAVLGFEVGYSCTNPNALVLWEAQFGDFANCAQPMIDQFIASGQSKWVRQSGIVLLLPHGMEGTGPEHTSCRAERFLQMCSDDMDTVPPLGPTFSMQQLYDTNWIVANCSTPANYFHVLRRQILLPFRKPLIYIAPKVLLRHPKCRSRIENMIPGTVFQRILEDDTPVANPKVVVFCTGKLYYELLEEREKRKLEKDFAFIRIEQLCPFPFDLLMDIFKKYPNAKLRFAQEEHKNQGFWGYVEPRMRTALAAAKDARSMPYAGRAVSASPATGSAHTHKKELAQLYNDIFAL